MRAASHTIHQLTPRVLQNAGSGNVVVEDLPTGRPHSVVAVIGHWGCLLYSAFCLSTARLLLETPPRQTAQSEQGQDVDAETLAARSGVHQALERILDRGRRDGTIRADVTARDIIVLTALLAQQLPNNRGPDQAPKRLKAFFLDGLAPPAR